MEPTKHVSDPYTTVQDPNKVPGWPPATDPASPAPSMYPNAIPAQPVPPPHYGGSPGGHPSAPPYEAFGPYAPTAPPPDSFSPLPPPPPPPPPPSAGASAGPPTGGDSAASLAPLNLPGVGAFKDRGHNLKDVPGATVTGGQATADRLAMLKTRVNELQKIREGYWRKQGITAAAGTATAFVSLGVGLAAGAAAGVHQRNKLGQIKKAIRGVLSQINLIRFQFAADPAVRRAEQSVQIVEAVFKHGIDRDELSGDF